MTRQYLPQEPMFKRKAVQDAAERIAELEAQIAALTARGEALKDIAAERQRQQAEEGWSPEHDDQHTKGEIAGAAASYAMLHSDAPRSMKPALLVPLWPRDWSPGWWKPKNPRRDLVRAAALLVAEIERLDRAALRTPSPDTGEPQ